MTPKETQLLISQQAPLLTWKRYSSFSKVTNMNARILRLVKIEDRKTVVLQPGELRKAEQKFWMVIQRDLYSNDIALIEMGNGGIT